MTIGKQIHGARLISIETDRVVLRHRGKLHTLYLTYSSDIKELKR